ncbi:hypothetical protein L484_017299 [Morus notabilis]|uniref:Uncharacterized protein n=1 Tax=Morus notabilis TaxID=981085 RepID=W9S0U0_9ROSA|nr:hypothetical protein L484_017299 [Morus notabilis]
MGLCQNTGLDAPLAGTYKLTIAMAVSSSLSLAEAISLLETQMDSRRLLTMSRSRD